MDGLKSLLTDNVRESHSKYKEKTQVVNYLHFIVSANCKSIIRFSPDDKERYAPFWCSGQFIDNTEYFNRIHEHIAVTEKDADKPRIMADMWASFLLSFKITINIHKDIPETKTLNDIREMSQSIEQQLIGILQDGINKLNLRHVRSDIVLSEEQAEVLHLYSNKKVKHDCYKMPKECMFQMCQNYFKVRGIKYTNNKTNFCQTINDLNIFVESPDYSRPSCWYIPKIYFEGQQTVFGDGSLLDHE